MTEKEKNTMTPLEEVMEYSRWLVSALLVVVLVVIWLLHDHYFRYLWGIEVFLVFFFGIPACFALVSAAVTLGLALHHKKIRGEMPRWAWMMALRLALVGICLGIFCARALSDCGGWAALLDTLREGFQKVL